MNIPEEMMREIREHAEAAYPEECCGVVFARADAPDELTRVRQCHNAQNEFHDRDPEVFPRSAGSAYFIDPKDLFAIEVEKRDRNEVVRAIYHSHPDARAYFSEEDQRCAVIDGEPLHPGVDFLVVPVCQGRAGVSALFSWNSESKNFWRSGRQA